MGDTDVSPVELAEVVHVLQTLDRECEGVAMYVVLEDRADAGEPAALQGPETEGPKLVEVAERYGRTLAPEAGLMDETRIAQVLEVLAATHFTFNVG